jgi:hypothetical protein
VGWLRNRRCKRLLSVIHRGCIVRGAVDYEPDSPTSFVQFFRERYVFDLHCCRCESGFFDPQSSRSSVDPDSDRKIRVLVTGHQERMCVAWERILNHMTQRRRHFLHPLVTVMLSRVGNATRAARRIAGLSTLEGQLFPIDRLI